MGLQTSNDAELRAKAEVAFDEHEPTH